MSAPPLATPLVRALLLTGLCVAAIGAPPACLLSTGGLPGGACGDGLRAAEEACDGDDLGGETCAGLGLGEGELRCTAECTPDVSACGVKNTCGDGVIAGGEACDGKDLGGEDCQSLGHLGGALACSAQCQRDESGCLDAPGDWLDVAWARRRTLTVQRAKVAEPISPFALLVEITEVGLGAAKADGGDLVFTAADGKTVLPHEIESFTGSPPTLVAWVAVDAISPDVDTVLYLYYENPLAAPKPPAGVWDASYAGVYHLGEAVSSGADGGLHLDATGQGRDGTQHGNGPVTGKIGTGQRFGGKGEYIDLAHPEQFALGDADCSISAWINTSSKKSMGIVLKSKALVHEPGDKLFGLNHDADKLGQDQGWVDYLSGTSKVDDGLWHHVVWTQKKDDSGEEERWTLYVDGAAESDKLATTKLDVPGHTLRVGWHADGSYFDEPFDGIIDELQLSAVTRSPGWVLTTFQNQRKPSEFVVVGPEESLPK